MLCIDTYSRHLKTCTTLETVLNQKVEFKCSHYLVYKYLANACFSIKILFKVIQFYEFASENSSNNRNDYLYIVSIELCPMRCAYAYGNVKVMP